MEYTLSKLWHFWKPLCPALDSFCAAVCIEEHSQQLCICICKCSAYGQGCIMWNRQFKANLPEFISLLRFHTSAQFWMPRVVLDQTFQISWLRDSTTRFVGLFHSRNQRHQGSCSWVWSLRHSGTRFSTKAIFVEKYPWKSQGIILRSTIELH